MQRNDESPVTAALAQFGLAGPVVAPLREARRSFERSYILAVLEQHQWRVGAAARALGLQRPNLYRKARQLRITLKPDQPQA
jgi:DNA-binding NtrC family response regulator